MKIEIGKTYAVRSVIGGHAVNNFQVQALGQDGWYYGLWMNADYGETSAGRFSAEGLTDKGGYKLVPNTKKVKKYVALFRENERVLPGSRLFDSEDEARKYWNRVLLVAVVPVEWEEEE